MNIVSGCVAVHNYSGVDKFVALCNDSGANSLISQLATTYLDGTGETGIDVLGSLARMGRNIGPAIMGV